ncbi:protocadherin gamma-A12-like [Gracilinanus agilis]|uniref:protocadherin gamma-A12-like n=1 Tax=Gracilinanus agilis TaxID=191870 RepID=UPI001CFD5CA9|nr:protocadherin gamma-A12-like [Gracilinanus agilis]
MTTLHRQQASRGRILFCCLLVLLWDNGTGQIHYSVPEEMEKGSFVGHIAKDMGLEPRELSERGARIVSRGKKQHFALNGRSGSLVTTDRIDREELCPGAPKCLLNVEILLQDKVKIYGIEVEVIDINDNAPRFQEDEVDIEVSEHEAPGRKFPLPNAWDLDVGTNGLQSYQLSPNSHFSLHVQSKADGAKYPELVLERALDREEEPVHHLIVTASDGGNPAHSGTSRVRVTVLDANDNAPVFTQSVYSVSIPENVPVGTWLLSVNATDPDEGVNGEVTYSFWNIHSKAKQVFELDSHLGSISTIGHLNYEESGFYEMEVQAKDNAGFFARANVLVTVVDVNDNAPEVTIASLTNSILESSPAGTVIALLNAHDQDSGENGQVMCSIPNNLPFKLEKSYGNYYSLVTSMALDREQVSMYNITVTVTDLGTPPLSTDTHITVHVADVNDNTPTFSQTSYSAYIPENNPKGSSLYLVTANDPDIEENAQITYTIADDIFQGAPLSSYVSINSETGVLYALLSFDYEKFRDLQLRVTATDSGEPPLNCSVSLTLFILDQNDNAPKVLYPIFPTDGSSGVELAPRSAEPGYLVTKIVAVDGDSGQNAWLFYSLLKATDPGLFSVGLHNGEIRTIRSFLDKDALKQNLVVAVTDKGEPPLSATVSVTVVVADSIPEILSDLSIMETPEANDNSNLTLYLIISVASVSCLFFAFIITLLGLRLHRWWRSHLLGVGSDKFVAVPASQFVDSYGVQAFLQSYSHEVSLTTDSQKSQLVFPQPNYADTLLSLRSCEKNTPLLFSGDSEFSKGNQNVIQVSPFLCHFTTMRC